MKYPVTAKLRMEKVSKKSLSLIHCPMLLLYQSSNHRFVNKLLTLVLAQISLEWLYLTIIKNKGIWLIMNSTDQMLNN